MSLGVARSCIGAGGLLGAAAVAAGAFGAHGLKALLVATGHADTWETASRYALVHAVALVATGLAAAVPGSRGRAVAAAGWCFGLGSLVFSGCLGVLAITGLGILGAVVPVGGALLIAGWLLLAASCFWRSGASLTRTGH